MSDSPSQLRRAERMRASPNWRDGAFQNPVPTHVMGVGDALPAIRRQLFGKEERVPKGELPLHARTRADFGPPAPSGVRLVWLGHSTSLLDLDGARILMDPVMKKRASPSEHVGPLRFHPPPLPVAEMPELDVVLISHDHYDHLDKPAVIELARRGHRFLTSLGVGAHLEGWGIDPARITELDWGESATVGRVRITAKPARHFSGRTPFDRNQTLWSSWVLDGPDHRVFFIGDSGYFEGMGDVGRDHGPFDLTLMKIGAYSESWPDIHLTPEDAVRLQKLVRGAHMVPIHWGTFNLAFHAWNDPPERLLKAAAAAGVAVSFPRLGAFFDPAAPGPLDPWWREVPGATTSRP